MNAQKLRENLRAYKRKFFLHRLMKGGLLLASILLGAYFLLATLEHFGHFTPTVRTVFFYSFVLLAGACLAVYIAEPIRQLTRLDKALSDEAAAAQLGQKFSAVKDKLLNTLQLMSSSERSALLAASLDQREAELGQIDFTTAIKYRENQKYLRFLLPWFLALGVVLIVNKDWVIGSTERLLKHNQQFVPQAPFLLEVNDTLRAFRGEPFELRVEIQSTEALPTRIEIEMDDRRLPLTRQKDGSFTYTFPAVREAVDFDLRAEGYVFPGYELKVVDRPSLQSLQAELLYPKYTGRKSEVRENIAHLTVPEGTQIRWNLKAGATEKMLFRFPSDKEVQVAHKLGGDRFRFERKFKESTGYVILPINRYGTSKEPVGYRVTVVPDRYPTLQVEQVADSLRYDFLALGGAIGDDYGISALRVRFRQLNAKGEAVKDWQSKAARFNPGQLTQAFRFQMAFDSLNLQPGERIEYYVEVWDNDGVNGAKRTKSATYTFQVPGNERLDSLLTEGQRNTESELGHSKERAEQLRRNLKQTQDKLRMKPKVDWQDKEALKDYLEERRELESELQEMKDRLEKFHEQQERFQPTSPELQEKARQLEELLDEVLDEDTQRMLDELEKLLEENRNEKQLRDLLDSLQTGDALLEEELERSLELFKQLQFEQQLESAEQLMNEAGEEMEKLAEESEQKGADSKELLEKQQEAEEKYERAKDALERLEEINKTLKNKREMGDFDAEQQEIDQQMQQGEQNLEKGKPGPAGKNQREAGEKMKQLSQQLAQMKQQMQQEDIALNIRDLRQILENLLDLSFDQEQLFVDLSRTSQSDPRYLSLSQVQVRLGQDSQVIQDSLASLAERVPQLSHLIREEVTRMNGHMDNSLDLLRRREPGRAVSEQQYAMTSQNELAVLLAEVLEQLQQQQMQMQQQQQGQGQSCPKPKSGEGLPDISQMQKQIGDRIQKLKGGQKTGRELSEELARLAAEQERLRQALREMEQKARQENNQEMGNQLREIQEQMEQQERDLVNKRVDPKTIERQKDIETRLLESEKAMREQKESPERESETGQNTEHALPPAIEEYLREKARQMELLERIPPQLRPYYQQKVSEYLAQ